MYAFLTEKTEIGSYFGTGDSLLSVLVDHGFMMMHATQFAVSKLLTGLEMLIFDYSLKLSTTSCAVVVECQNWFNLLCTDNIRSDTSLLPNRDLNLQ